MPLTSEILERRFGPTEIKVLYQDDSDRIIRTSVIETGQVLQVARTAFIAAGVEAFPVVHDKVLDGKSMGKAFREAGIRFTRVTRAVARLSLPGHLTDRFGFRGRVTAVDLRVLVGPSTSRVHYADVLEIYSEAVPWRQRTTAPPQAMRGRAEGLFERLCEVI